MENAEAVRLVTDFQNVSEAEARGVVMRFSPEAPMFVGKYVYEELKAIGFLKDPKIAARIRLIQKLPTA